jgi:hypothetical protein
LAVKYYQLLAINSLVKESARQKKLLFDELVESATDDVIFKRRIRMLTQLNQFESQLLKKIQNFKTEDVTDFVDGIDFMIQELNSITSRNA